MILPRPKSVLETEGFFTSPIVCDSENEYSQKIITLINIFSPDTKVCVDKSPNFILKNKDFGIKGAYKLSVKQNIITATFGDYEGLRNAIATLVQLNENGKLKCAEIIDSPDNAFRSCLFDLARGFVEIDILKEHLVRLARLKFNVVHMHLMDRPSYILESNVVPNPDNNKQYTKKELRELVEFCNLLGLDAIPEIEFPAHCVNLIKAIPELQCDIIDIKKAQKSVEDAENPRKVYYIDNQNNISSWAVCIGKESTYKIYEAIIDELLEIFDSEYIHIGADEIEFRKLGAFPNWDNCHACKELYKQYNGDLLSMYHHGIRKIHEIVKSKGKKTIKWNESTECEHSVDLPSDIIFEYWRSDSTDASQSDIDRFIDMGFTIINAPYPYTYVDLHEYMTADKIKSWTPARDDVQKKAILGGEMCAWELGNEEYSYYYYTLPICTVLFCDRVWNSDIAEYTEEYIKYIFTSVIGDNSLKISPLTIFEDIIPPRKKNVLEELNYETIDLQKLSYIIEDLRTIDKENCYGKIALENFITYLTNLLGEIKKQKKLT